MNKKNKYLIKLFNIWNRSHLFLSLKWLLFNERIKINYHREYWSSFQCFEISSSVINNDEYLLNEIFYFNEIYLRNNIILKYFLLICSCSMSINKFEMNVIVCRWMRRSHIVIDDHRDGKWNELQSIFVQYSIVLIHR